jgi:rRNA-processing protein FCF1
VKNDDSAKNVLLDTNSLIYAVRSHVDLRDQVTYLVGRCEIIVPQCVIDELKGLSTGNINARTALGIVQRFITVQSEGKGDECVFNTAVKLHAYVVTNDRNLALKLHENDLRCLMFTAKKMLSYWNFSQHP